MPKEWVLTKCQRHNSIKKDLCLFFAKNDKGLLFIKNDCKFILYKKKKIDLSTHKKEYA